MGGITAEAEAPVARVIQRDSDTCFADRASATDYHDPVIHVVDAEPAAVKWSPGPELALDDLVVPVVEAGVEERCVERCAWIGEAEGTQLQVEWRSRHELGSEHESDVPPRACELARHAGRDQPLLEREPSPA